MTEREKMTRGEWFDPKDEELAAARLRATQLMHRFNVGHDDHGPAYRRTMIELCPDCRGFIRAPFYCDYGFNIHIGRGAFVNFAHPHRRPHAAGAESAAAHGPSSVRRRRTGHRKRGRTADRHRSGLLVGRRGHRLPGRYHRRPIGHRCGRSRYARHSVRHGRRRQSGPCHSEIAIRERQRPDLNIRRKMRICF